MPFIKYIVASTLMLFTAASSLQAQTVDEWTQQKKTQLKHLLKQIAALRSYGEVAAKGYAIAQKGLTTIRNIKKGDFSLHQAYFTSLRKVNPRVKAYWKVGATIALQIQILQQCKKQRKVLQNSSWTAAFQIKHDNAVFNHLLNGCVALLDDLLAATTNDSLQMKDEERLKRIDRLYAAMQERYVFLQNFCAETSILRLQQKREAMAVKTLRALYDAD